MSNQSGWEQLQMLHERQQIEDDSLLTMVVTVNDHLLQAQNKPSRIRVKRDSSYLAQQAQGLFRRNSHKPLVNPTDYQLDKIFRGEL